MRLAGLSAAAAAIRRDTRLFARIAWPYGSVC